ncbi:hypothetical protein [Promicromonospora sp. NPDC057488]|uniref:hypothetical protein n=1 Tax=Promicromonospora sp. NPDC057488 TaxID=3346147 RepID=UPI00366B15BD
MTTEDLGRPDHGAEAGTGTGARRDKARRTATALVLLTMLGAGGLSACSSLGGTSVAASGDWAQHSAGGVSFNLPPDWEYQEGLSWPGSWAPSDGAEGGPSFTVETLDAMSADTGNGAQGKAVDVPGAVEAEYWHHDVPPEGGDQHEIAVTLSEWTLAKVVLTAGDLSDAESRSMFDQVVASLRVEGDDDFEVAGSFGPYTDLTPTGADAELPDLGDLPSGVPDGWDTAGTTGLGIALPGGWPGEPDVESAAWIHPGTGARIRVDEAASADKWETGREGTPFTMEGADVAVASASVVTDKTGQELVEVQVDVRREGGSGYTAFVDAPAAVLPDLLIPFLGSLSFEPEAGGTGGWVNGLPEYPDLADPPADWAEDTVNGRLRLAAPARLERESEGFWIQGTHGAEAMLDVYFYPEDIGMDAPTQEQVPGQTSVRVDGATSVLVEEVKDHDGGPDTFVGVAEIVLETGEVCSISYHADGIEKSRKEFGQILGSLEVLDES